LSSASSSTDYTPTLLERFYDWRNRLYASARFRDWAIRFPLTRGVSAKNARDVFDLVAGFVYSQVLLACVRLEVLALVASTPKPLEELVAHTGMPRDAALRLVNAAISLELLSRRQTGHIALGRRGAMIVGNPAVVAMIRHHALFYGDLQDPVALLNGTTSPALARYWPYAAEGGDAASGHVPPQVIPYSELMSASQPLVAGLVLDAVDFSRFRTVLDVGGGDGSFLRALGAKHAAVSLCLFDLPAVTERARLSFEAAGFQHRAQVVGGSFLTDPLPLGADAITLVRVVHDHDDARVQTLLAKAFAALPPGGMLIIAEPMAEVAGAAPVGAAYFGFYFLAMGRGEARSPERLTSMLIEAGFDRPIFKPTALPLQVSVLCARKPA
jgi:demethylspheroidene O-methyltransferase